LQAKSSKRDDRNVLELYWWQKLRRAGRNADGIRDHKVQAERHKSAIELAPLRAFDLKLYEHITLSDRRCPV
jgi:hypothetical protein